MRIIQINENQKEEWNKFVAENSSESFLQAWEWGEFQKSLGRKIFRIGVVDDNKFPAQGWSASGGKFIVVAFVVKYDLPLGRSYFYCPRGPVITNNLKLITDNLLKEIFDYLKSLAEKEKALFLRFDPPMEMNNELEISPLKKGTGGIFKKTSSEIQPRDTLILDITKSEEELLKEMKQKTRYNIRLAGRKELRILNLEFGTSQDSLESSAERLQRDGIIFKKCFEEFWKLVKETSKRDKFKSHYKDYYWKMLGSLNNSEDNLNNSEGDIPECRLQNYLNCLQTKLYFAKYKNEIIVANIVLYFGDHCVYLHGASSSKNRNTMAPYLLQWRQILDAKKRGCKTYDFWGMSSSKATFRNVAFEDDTWNGITRFKKGFGGDEKNYIGAYDLVFNNIGYAIYKFIKLKVIK